MSISADNFLKLIMTRLKSSLKVLRVRGDAKCTISSVHFARLKLCCSSLKHLEMIDMNFTSDVTFAVFPVSLVSLTFRNCYLWPKMIFDKIPHTLQLITVTKLAYDRQTLHNSYSRRASI